jgi:hypothetical protein
MMDDYSKQDWRKPDPEIEHDNEFVAVAFALFVGIALGATICGWWWA